MKYVSYENKNIIMNLTLYDYPHAIYVENKTYGNTLLHKKIIDWLNKNCVVDNKKLWRYNSNGKAILFTNKKDAMLFKLSWS